MNEVPKSVTIIVGRYAGNIFAQESRLEDVFQIFPCLKHRQNIDYRQNVEQSFLTAKYSSFYSFEQIAFFVSG